MAASTPLARLKASRYSDSQPRDSHGRWTSGGDDSGSTEGGGGGGSLTDQIKAAAAAGGGTIDPATGQEATSGYAVAIPGHSSITPDSEFFNGKGEATIHDWMNQNADVLSRPGMHIGVWHDTEHGEVVLDPSHVVADRATAIQEGIAGDQQAIYHLDSGTEIPTGGTGGRSQDPHLDRSSGKALESDDRGRAAGVCGRCLQAGSRPHRALTPLARRSGKLSQKSVHYRESDGPSSEHCGSCSMFRPIAGKTGTCTLVAGVIEADHVCDRWAPRALNLNPEE